MSARHIPVCLRARVCPLCEPYLRAAGCLHVHHSSSWSTCMHKHTQGSAVCASVTVCVVAEQRDPFCQSGQCWKRFKATSTVDILPRLFSGFTARTLFNMFRRNEEFALRFRVSKCACARKLSVFIIFVCRCACMWVTGSRREQETVGLERSQRSRKICCN